ncbi:MAG TPA: TRAP transporter substrate-binding protein [Acidobacteriota bacterium]|nr:TRAP transporter substrate-binding protein [Acidobacteriota bacterium]
MSIIRKPGAMLVLVASLVVGACGGGEPDVFVLKVAASAPAEDPGPQTLQLFVDRINEASGGRIDARLYAGSALGEDRDVTEGLKLGTVEMLMSPSSTLATFVPEMYVFELPFLFDDNEHMFAVLDSEIGEGLRPALEREGFHLMGYFSYGLRHIMTTERAVETIEDLRGLKIRTMESPPHLDAFAAFGASPLPMAYNELYTSLETGVIDGAEAANSNYYSKRFFEVAPYWAHVGWLRLVAPVLMSKVFYDRLPADLQELVDATLTDLVDYERQLYTDIDERRLQQLLDAGVTVTYPGRDAFVAASAAVYDAWAARVGGREQIDAILDYPR